MEDRKECYNCKFLEKCRDIVDFNSYYCRQHRKEKNKGEQ